jgi:hypothetical protein
VNSARDIFDELEQENDPFESLETTEQISLDTIKSEIGKVLERFDSKERKKEKKEIIAEIMPQLLAEIAKIKPKQNVIERQIEQVIKHVQVPVHLEPKIIEKPVETIREVRVEVQTPVKDTRKLVEESALVDLQKKIDALQKEVKEAREIAEQPIFAPGGSGVIGIPPPEGNEGKVLTVTGNKAKWETATASSGSGHTDEETLSLGDATADGSWQLTISGTDLLVQKRESGSWVTKGTFLP